MSLPYIVLFCLFFNYFDIFLLEFIMSFSDPSSIFTSLCLWCGTADVLTDDGMIPEEKEEWTIFVTEGVREWTEALTRVPFSFFIFFSNSISFFFSFFFKQFCSQKNINFLQVNFYQSFMGISCYCFSQFEFFRQFPFFNKRVPTNLSYLCDRIRL